MGTVVFLATVPIQIAGTWTGLIERIISFPSKDPMTP